MMEYRDMRATEEEIERTERANGSDIYIRFMANGITPVAYENSAVFLNRCFPQYPVVQTRDDAGSREYRMVAGFSLEEVLERFAACQVWVDDFSVRIQNVF